MKIVNGRFVEKEVATDGSLFAETSGDGKEIDAAGCYVIPGLIDIHFHGCAGVDFCDGTVEAMRHMAEYELKNGVTSIHPATIRTSFKMFGKERIILISDSMMATGMPDGIYSLGGQEVQVHGNKATLTVDEDFNIRQIVKHGQSFS